MTGICGVEGCERDGYRRGWCVAHYGRWLRHGDPERMAANRGRPLKGDVLTFGGVHKRLSRQRGPASAQVCVDCGSAAQEWSYDGEDIDAVQEVVKGALVSYSLDLSHYAPRCISCHRRFDGAGDRGRNANGTFANRGEQTLAGMGQ